MRCRVWVLLPLSAFCCDVLAENDAVWPNLQTWQVVNGELVYLAPQFAPVQAEPEPHWLDQRRQAAAQYWKQITSSVDMFFSDDDMALISDSYAYLRLRHTFEGEDPGSDVDFKLKTDFPRTENRLAAWMSDQFQFILASDADDLKDLSNQNFDRNPDNQLRDRDRNVNTSIRWIVFQTDQWEFDFDLGLRWSQPVDPFARLTLTQSYQWSETWRASWQHKAFAFNDRDSGYQTRFLFSKYINQQWEFSNASKARWTDESQTFSYSNVSSLIYIANQRLEWVAQAGGFYDPLSELGVKNYYLQLRAIREIYNDWIFGDLVPRVDFYEQQQYAPSWSLSLALEFYIDQ